MPERPVEQSTRNGHLDIRSDYRLSAADCRPHGFPEHRMYARTAVLHFARNTNDRTLAIRDCGSVEQLEEARKVVALAVEPGTFDLG